MSNIDRLNKPPLNEGDVDTFVWKRWFDTVYLQYFNDANPNEIVYADRTLALGFLIPTDCTTGTVTLTLPKASTCKGKRYIIKKIDASANTVVITADTTEPDLIDGAATKVLTNQWEAVYIESDGLVSWYLLGEAGGGGGAGTVTSVTAEDETVVIGGTATDPTVRTNTTDVLEAGENLTGGMWVNVYNVAGTAKVRKADATLGQGYHCVGFVVDTVLAGATVKVYTTGINSHVSGMTPGDVWLGTAGAGTNTPPNTAGYISQQIGIATSATEVGFEPQEDILIGPAASAGTGLILKDEGVTLGPITTLDIVGAAAVASISSTDGTITINASTQVPTLYVYFP